MKTNALIPTVFVLAATSLCGQSDIEFLRARTDAHERKIIQLEKEIAELKSNRAERKTTPAAKPAPAGSSSETYMVKKGDILTRIAYRNKTTVAAIMKENGLRNDRIFVGQKLRIPGAATAAAPVPPRAVEVAEKSTPKPTTASRHTVKSGETFYSIARQHKVSVSSLMASNPNVRPTSMRVGQRLVIDGNAKPTPAKKSVAKASTPKKKASKASKHAAEYVDPPKSKSKTKTKEVVRNAPQDRKTISTAPSASEPAIRTITVHQQMTYGQFASKYGASTSQLNALNGLSLSKNTMLAKGSELYVPKY